MREIIDGYDYTRPLPLAWLDQGQSPSPNRFSKGVKKQQTPHRALRAHFHNNDEFPQRESPKETSSKGHSDLMNNLPCPPIPSARSNSERSRERRTRLSSEIPTSEQTYGETNQLLRITPPHHTGIEPSLHDVPSSLELAALYMRQVQSEEEKESNGHDVTRAVNTAGIPRIWSQTELPRSLPGTGPNCAKPERCQRSSSIYPADNDSAWETQVSDSRTDVSMFMRYSSDSQAESYADTSVHSSQADYGGHFGSFVGLGKMELEGGKINALVQPTGRASYIPGSDQHFGSGLANAAQKSDTERAIGFLRTQLSARTDASPGEKDKRQHDAEELEILRRKNPAAVRRAVELISKRPLSAPLQVAFTRSPKPKPLPFSRSAYEPKIDFPEAIKLSPMNQHHNRERPQTPARSDHTLSGGLYFSDSANTFKTIRPRSSPLSPSENEAVTLSPVPINDEWPLCPGTSPSFRAMSGEQRATTAQSTRSATHSQTELKPFRLFHSNTSRAASPFYAASHLERAAHSPPIHDPVRNWRPRIGKITTDSRRVLIRDRWDWRDSAALEAQNISSHYAYYAAFSPFTSLAFAWGHFDPIIARKTKGRFSEMSPEDKRSALVKSFPISLVVYLFVSVIVGIAVWASLSGA